jgi:hypothetical protein
VSVSLAAAPQKFLVIVCERKSITLEVARNGTAVVGGAAGAAESGGTEAPSGVVIGPEMVLGLTAAGVVVASGVAGWHPTCAETAMHIITRAKIKGIAPGLCVIVGPLKLAGLMSFARSK